MVTGTAGGVKGVGLWKRPKRNQRPRFWEGRELLFTWTAMVPVSFKLSPTPVSWTGGKKAWAEPARPALVLAGFHSGLEVLASDSVDVVASQSVRSVV